MAENRHWEQLCAECIHIFTNATQVMNDNERQTARFAILVLVTIINMSAIIVLGDIVHVGTIGIGVAISGDLDAITLEKKLNNPTMCAIKYSTKRHFAAHLH